MTVDLDLDLLPDGLVVADATGAVVRINSAAARLLGIDAADMLGSDLDAVLAVDDRAGHRWAACMRPYDGWAGRTRISESSWFSGGGSEVLVTARLVREHPRGPVRTVVVSLRSARSRAAHERERSDLVATVAHELRSPLTGIKGFTATLLNKWDRFNDEQRLLMLATVDNDADRLSRLITELLDAARIDSGRLSLRPELLRLDTAVQRVLDSLSAGAETLVVRADEQIEPVWVDPDRLAQVVTNLVENASRHGHGVTAVRLEPAGAGRTGGVLHIEDSGPGIPADVRDRVFTRFWTSGTKGSSGLGLYIVQGIVQGHGGSISIGDVEGGGARLSVHFPLNEPDFMSD